MQSFGGDFLKTEGSKKFHFQHEKRGLSSGRIMSDECRNHTTATQQILRCFTRSLTSGDCRTDAVSERRSALSPIISADKLDHHLMRHKKMFDYFTTIFSSVLCRLKHSKIQQLFNFDTEISQFLTFRTLFFLI